ncbi:MAG: hypothetical protein H0T72_01895 [Chloroflexia bacterium]|nr:hypothetical protein [Chloroflexia bacterium]
MTVEKVRSIDGEGDVRFGRFMPDNLDPRNALSIAARDGMIAMRREAGLSDFPAQPLYPDRQVRFEPEPTQATPSGIVAE